MSVIIVSWDRADLLQDALRSIQSQKTDLAIEVIVVDNGSKDGTSEVIAREFPEIRLIQNTENKGFCAANNQGFAVARGAFVALLNNDAVADREWITHLHNVFHDNPEIGMAACKIVDFIVPERIDKAGHILFLDGQNRGRGTGHRDRGQFERREEVLWPDGCACMYRKTMLDQIGGFDEDFFAYGDDAELGLRARIAGWRCIYEPRAIVRHRRGTSLGRGNPDRLKLIERNRILLAAKLFPWSLLWLNPLFFGIRVAGTLFTGGLGGDIGEFKGIRGKWDLLAGMVRGQLSALQVLPRILRKRSAIQRFRVLSPADVRRLILSQPLGVRGLLGFGPEVSP